MTEKRVQFSNIVQNQLPAYVRADFPLISDFLKQYYIAQEFQSGPIDLIQNIDEYVKVDQTTNLNESVVLSADIGVDATTISVDLIESERGTDGFPDTYGLLKINDEIITYTSKTDTSFVGCVRGFAGTTDYKSESNPDSLVFQTSDAATHTKGSNIVNLSCLFLKQFLLKSKYQLLPGFEGRALNVDLDQNIFIKQAKDFYLSKGTDRSFEILFKALYNEDVNVIKPKDRLFTPSNAEYRITKDIVVEPVTGDPSDLTEATLYQDAYSDTIEKAYAPITSVEQISAGAGNTFYKLSIDSGYNRDVRVDGSIYGTFAVNPKTQIIGKVSVGTTVFDVDSTISFPNSGELYVTYEDENVGVVSYTSKSITQFYGLTNVNGTILDGTVVGINTYAYGTSGVDGSTVKVRITSILENCSYPDNTVGQTKNSVGKINTLGCRNNSFKYTDWIYNVAPIYQIKSFELIDVSNFTYNVTLDTDHYFNIGDSAQIITSGAELAESMTTKIVSINSATSFSIQGQGQLPTQDTYKIKRLILRCISNSFPEASIYSTNVQNVYKDSDNLLVASPSIPSYPSQPINASTRSISFKGTFVGDEFNITDLSDGTIIDDHGFYTGDEVYYTPEIVTTSTISPITGQAGITTAINYLLPKEGLYFIKRIDSRIVQFAVSTSDIYNGKFISVPSTTVTNQVIEPYKFKNKTLESQKLLREISNPENGGTKTKTEAGFTGILINGVEILNYKSPDVIRYGKIEEIEVLAEGSEYDLINIPTVNITDAVGTGATGYLGVSGNLKELRIKDPGYNYAKAPTVTITGGGGDGAKATAKMKLINNEPSFVAQVIEGVVNVGLGATNSTIGFSTYHRFNNAEKVVYVSNGQKSVTGLSTNNVYYAGLKSSTKIALHTTEEDAIVGVNTVTLSDYGVGTQFIKSYEKKLVVDSFIINDSGYEYKNNRTSTLPVGVNTSTNQINIDNHHYESGDTIKYTTLGTKIDGLDDGSEYVVTKVDDDNFKLSALGPIGDKTFNYDTNQYIQFTSVGVGVQLFNYPDIVVSLSDDAQDIQGIKYPCDIDPIFRGSVKSINLTNNGVGYGSSEIINFDRQPLIELSKTVDAQLTPIVNDGKIIEVFVNYPGTGYFSPPDLIINGAGIGADLVPIIENGAIKEVRVINEGTGYVQNTTNISIVSPGTGAEFRAKIKEWTLNLVEKNKDRFTADDGFITIPRNVDFGLQYSHLYAPRKLRGQTFAVGINTVTGDTLYGQSDLQIVNGEEATSQYHSPIIGWAYDGNPIYGPYGYTSVSGGSVGQLKSGYEIQISDERPPLNVFPEGFFIQDYTYVKTTDALTLDENNGRFCITPDYPLGTYAYFSTITPGQLLDSDGPFEGFKSPVFPYLIGDSFNSKVNTFNLQRLSNQDSIDLNDTNWSRNTTPYNLIDGTLQYEYIAIPNDLSQTVDITSVTPGSVDKIGINTGGYDYKVGDSVVFDETGTKGYGANAKVSSVKGQQVKSVSLGTTSIEGVEFYSSTNDTYEVVATNPHEFKLNDNIIVSGLSTTSSKLEGAYNIGITTANYSLTGAGSTSSGVGNISVTGIVTYFSVDSTITAKPNDIFKIGTEQIKVLNPEPTKSRLRVLRGQNGTTGSAHTVTTTLFEQQRRLTINAGFHTTDSIKRNTELYFDPSESVSVGVGIGTTLSFSNPGAGISELFVPSKSIYIPNHNLETGDVLTYNSNTGTALSVRYNESSSIVSLTDGQELYAAKISSDLVGIATVFVGVGTTGTFTGIASAYSNSSTLFFTGIGTGVYHSFKTNYKPITGNIKRNLVTVSTASTHGLVSGDVTDIDINVSIGSTFIVGYNDYNRRIVINPRDFGVANVDVATNTITIPAHGYFTGQKVIHTAATPCVGLEDNAIYYIVVTGDNTIKLSQSYYDATLLKPNVLNITGASNGTINPINPGISAYKDSVIDFNLTSPSLAYYKLTAQYSAFELDFYTDKEMTTLWNKSSESETFEINRRGSVGISTNANVTVAVNKNTPSTLYYKFNPIFESDLPDVKKEIVVDTENTSNSEVEVKESLYNGKQQVSVGIGSTNSFTYTLTVDPEKSSYISSTSKLDYTTSSKTALGGISDFKVLYGGSNYYSLPGISTITTDFGKDAIINAATSTIGKINNTELSSVGFNFPSDKTLRPSLNLPQVIEVDTLQGIESVGITSVGRGYSSAPTLLVFDGKTNEEVDGIDLAYDLESSTVTILSNTAGVSDASPTILPTKNSNGVGISTISYNSSSKDVTVSLAVGFGTDDTFPFAYGDKVMIEGVSVGVGSTGQGYNSENYGYQLFSLLSVAKNPGGIATVRYGLSEYYPDSIVTPGNIDIFNSAGRIIAEKDFPSFDVTLKSKDYFIGETVKSTSASGTVEGWSAANGILNVTSNTNFKVGERITGETSNSQGIASSVTSYDSYINLDYFSIVKNGWQSDSGVLNNNIQRVQDNLYYQRFAYSLKSRVPYSTWEDVVGSLNHTLGFKNFADFQAESSNIGSYGIIGSQVTFNAPGISTTSSSGDWVLTSTVGSSNVSYSPMTIEPAEPSAIIDRIQDVIGYANLNTVQDFEIATENALSVGSQLVSTELVLSGARVLTDYFESIGNRVLSIDDISSQFNSNPRTTTFSVVSKFDLADVRSLKFITYVKDKRFFNTRQLMIVDLVHDNYIGYLNQYGRIENVYDLGSFDFNITGTEGELLFYPNKYQVNDYEITALSYNLNDNLLGVGSSVFGAAAEVKTSSVEIPANTPTTIVSLASTYRAAKVLVSLTADSTKIDAGGEFEFDELNVLNDGTNVEIVEYPQLITSPGAANPIPGFGTYSGYLEGNLLKIDFHPHNSTAGVGTTSIVNTIQVAISSETSTGSGSFDLKHARIEGKSTTISASGSPTENVIGSYPDDYDAAYFIVQISDTTNDTYYLSEVIALDDYDADTSTGDTYNAEYGIIESVSGLGTIGTRITGSVVELVYTPLPSIDAHVNVFMNALRIQDDSRDVISLENGTIQTEYGEYFGTERDIKRAFELKHQTNDIFNRSFDGSSTSVVDLTKNTIQMANHYFVTGEELQYIHAGAGTTQALGIASTDGFVGVGTTDKLPSSVFAVKITEDKIKLAATAKDALMGVVNNVDFTSVGIGTSHRFVSTNQNSKVLVTLDNIIQSPLVSTAVTTHLENEVFTTSDIVEFAGITSFFGGDLIKVGNEIMKIEGIGVGNTNTIRVRRQWLGTSLAGYSTGDVVTKVIGNYNIVENTLNFVEAPYGTLPMSSTTNPPDSRDWVGIATGSHFQGRSFMRSGIPNTAQETYARNYIFDDISSGFTGTERDFVLTSAGGTVTGIENDNAIILINDVFQGPGIQYDYTLEESGSTGITTISFTGTASSIASDVNTSNLPVGGVIVSVGSTAGFGYQPLVAAGGTAVVSAAGTISLVSIGNSGSGYRSGIQTTVNVGIQTESLAGVNIVSIGTASISNGNIVGVAVTNSQVFYAPRVVDNAVYNNSTGELVVTTSAAHGLNVGSEVLVSGIAFTCTYSSSAPRNLSNFVYDNVTGIATVTTTTAHALSVGKDVIFTGIAMTCGLDGGSSTHVYPRTTDPYYSGSVVTKIISVQKFETNVGVSTVPTFYQSGGTVQRSLMTPRATDPAAEGTDVIEVLDSTRFAVNVGISTTSHLYARGGSVTMPMEVVFDSPLGYSNIPLIYSSSSVSGVGSNATIDIAVGRGSSVTDFTLRNTGYGYGNGEILTVAIGGTTGIPTTSSYHEFQLTIDEIFTDEFTGWSVGQLQDLDDVAYLFDGNRLTFPLSQGGVVVSIRASKGSPINIEDTLLIFVNDVLQVPGEGFKFEGGSTLTFTEAPKAKDTCKIIFYKGSGDQDVKFRDVIEPVEVGDTLTPSAYAPTPSYLQEDPRTVTLIKSTNNVDTIPYYGPGITADPNQTKPVILTRQTEDMILNGKEVSKDRGLYEPRVIPAANIIKAVGVTSTQLYVDNVKPIFDSQNESDIGLTFQDQVTLTSQVVKEGATATSVVSTGGTISSISVVDGGTGYDSAPNVVISNAVGFGSTATATAQISGGSVTGVTVSFGGTNYSESPQVLIEPPTLVSETNDVDSYIGDYGVVVGFGTTTISTVDKMIMDLYIPTYSDLREPKLVGTAITISSLDLQDYFMVFASNAGSATTSITSKDTDNNIIGVGTQFIDNIYQVSAVSNVTRNVVGVGMTVVRRVYANISGLSTVTFGTTGIDFSSEFYTFDDDGEGTGSGFAGIITASNYFGNYSWGKITLTGRSETNQFEVYPNDGISGISTWPLVQRTIPLKSSNYII